MVNIYDSFVKCIVQGGLQRFLCLRHLAANDIEVAVPAPDSVQKLLLNLGRNQSYMIMQIIQAAHAGGTHRNQFVSDLYNLPRRGAHCAPTQW